jgi:hypothetical protein
MRRHPDPFLGVIYQERNMKKEIIRKGDKVKVVIPKFVARVGYPKTVDDYLEPLRQQYGSNLDLLFFSISGDTHRFVGHDESSKQRLRVERELAYLMARRDHFGGYDRTIHWLEKPEFKDSELVVIDVRTVYTGRCYPGSGQWDDYEPGGLDNRKCHRIARVRFTVSYYYGPGKFKLGLEIPVYHLEKIQP